MNKITNRSRDVAAMVLEFINNGPTAAERLRRENLILNFHSANDAGKQRILEAAEKCATVGGAGDD